MLRWHWVLLPMSRKLVHGLVTHIFLSGWGRILWHMVSGGMRYVIYFIKFYIYPTGTIRSLQTMFTWFNMLELGIFNDLLDILGCIFIALEVIIHVATWLSWEHFLKLTFKGGHWLGFNRIFNEQLWYWPIIAFRIINETSQGMQDILMGCSGTDYSVKLEQCFTPKRRLHHTIKSIWLEILFIKAFSENKAYKHWYL